MSGKLYEVLAVEEERKKTANAILQETTNTLKQKDQHFQGFHKTLQMFNEDRKEEAEAFEEHKEIVTTVNEKLQHLSSSLIKYYDVLAQKESTNQIAVADVILPGEDKALLFNMPATVLLAMERELKKVRECYLQIPTLAPNYSWEEDESQGKDIFRLTHPVKTHKTEKKLEVITLSEATDKHKAQVTTEKIDKPVGQYITNHWSGTIKPSRKSLLLSRIDELIIAVKEARMRANEAIVNKIAIGEKIFEYINK